MATGVTGHTGAHAAGRVGVEPRPGHGGATIPRRDQGARTAGGTVKRREDAMNRNAQVVTFACNFALCIEAPPTVHSSFELHTLRMSKRLEAVRELLLQVLLHSDKLEGCQAQVSQYKEFLENRLACGSEHLSRSKSIWVVILGYT